MQNQLQELLGFLHDRNPQVRQIALSNLLGHTPKGSPHRGIFFAGLGGGLRAGKETEVIRDLKLLCRDQTAIAHDAFRALVNLSDSPVIIPYLSDNPFLSFLVSYIVHPPSVLADLASMLLSNLTAQAAPCSALLGLKIPVILSKSLDPPYYPTNSRSGTSPVSTSIKGEEQQAEAFPLLVDAFVRGAKLEGEEKDKRRKGELHFLASVFANVSVTPAGRLLFLTPKPVAPFSTVKDQEYLLSKIVAFTEHADTIRRGGVTSTIKNCAFYAAGHKATLSPETEKVSCPPSTVLAPGINVLPYILLPLAGPEELDLEDTEQLPAPLQFLPDTKKREPDPVLRLTHIETLLLFCTTRWGRDYLRENGVYQIIRIMHETETVDKIAEHIERLVNLLKRDEDPNSRDDEADETAVAPAVAEDDGEDDRIEEV